MPNEAPRVYKVKEILVLGLKRWQRFDTNHFNDILGETQDYAGKRKVQAKG